MDIQEILEYMPHRYPFLLVDRVLECEPGVSLTALKNVTVNEPFFQGHFPGFPVMPGVLILEAMAQAMGLLVMQTMRADGKEKEGMEIFFFAGVDKARFKQPVVPGDQLILEVTLGKIKSSIYKADVVAKVDDKVVSQAGLMIAYRGPVA
jgi:3-hydroxyacyl-[acyl-carrier-protein] dehydratase